MFGYICILFIVVLVYAIMALTRNMYIRTVLISILVLFSMNMSIYKVSNNLMEPNYFANDILICYNTDVSIFNVPMFSWFNVPAIKHLIKPSRYDVVIIRRPCKRGDRYYVKRVIGLENDEIIIENGDIFINGNIVSVTPIVNKEYVYEHCNNKKSIKVIQFNKNFKFKGKVPKHRMLMLSDNRTVGWGDDNYYRLSDIYSMPLFKISAIFDYLYINRFMWYLYSYFK